MGKKPENLIVNKARERFDKEFPGIYHVKIHGDAWQEVGIPDVLACYRGMFIAIEFKWGDAQPSTDQEFHLERIGMAGCVAYGVANSVEKAVQIVRKALQFALTPIDNDEPLDYNNTTKRKRRNTTMSKKSNKELEEELNLDDLNLEEDEGDEAPDYESMSLDELKDECEARDIEVPKKAKKAALIELLEASDEEEDEEEDEDEDEDEDPDYEDMDLEELLELCEEREIKVGKKLKKDKEAVIGLLETWDEENSEEEEEEEEPEPEPEKKGSKKDKAAPGKEDKKSEKKDHPAKGKKGGLIDEIPEGALSTKEVADMIGIEPRELRVVLRKEFYPDNSNKRYFWMPGSKELKEILDYFKPKGKAAKAEDKKPAGKKTGKK